LKRSSGIVKILFTGYSVLYRLQYNNKASSDDRIPDSLEAASGQPEDITVVHPGYSTATEIGIGFGC